MRDSAFLLQSGFMGKLTALRELQLLAGLSDQQAAELCFVSPETYRRWRSDRQPNPMAVRLLAIMAGYVPWPRWDGWEVHNSYLFPPGYSQRGILPGDIMAVPFLMQLVSEYKRVLAKAESELATLELDAQPRPDMAQASGYR